MALDEMRQQPGRQYGIADPGCGHEKNVHRRDRLRRSFAFYERGTTIASGLSGVIRPARNRVGPATVYPEPLLRALANPALERLVDRSRQRCDIGRTISGVRQL